MTHALRQQSIKALLVVTAVLLAANLAVHWLSDTRVSQAKEPVSAVNGIPDSGAQIQAVVDEVRGTNKRLDALQSYLESGALTVKAKIEKDDKDAK
jgi:hypothetical protein